MNMDINEIQFGNPDRKLIQYQTQESILDSLLEELKNHPFPQNDSDKVREELTEIAIAVQNLPNDLLQRFEIYDYTLDTYIIENLSKQGVDKESIKQTISDIDKDILPIIVKLKYHYQRIRPLQLARLLQVNLIPFPSLSANTPAYPSGHTIQARVYAEVLGNKYPQFYKPLNELATDVMMSRLYMGVHYASDCQFGDYVAQVIVNHPDFKKKYRL